MFTHPITISLSPNTESDDVTLACYEIIRPWKWFGGLGKQELSSFFYKKFQASHVSLYNSGRSALYELLKAFGIGPRDEVIVQAFTCVAVPNSVLWLGAIPVYADIDETYNATVDSLQKVLTKKTKAIIVQHTFGIPAKIDQIVAFAKKNNIILIEDCAHALGASYKGKLLGSFGDGAFFSFGRDKVVSSVFGGVAIVHKNEQVIEKIKHQEKNLPTSRYWWVFQQLFHPIALSIILPLYTSGLGKLLLILFQTLKLLSFPVYPEEKFGQKPKDFPALYPDTLARLALNQIKKLDRYNAQRKTIAGYYRTILSDKFHGEMVPDIEGAIYMRFPLQMNNRHNTLSFAKKRGILLGNWYQSVIDPKGVNNTLLKYSTGSCPNAEYISEHVMNLPTRISIDEAKKVIAVLQYSQKEE